MGLNFAVIDRITTIVTGTVRHFLNKVFRLSEQLQNGVGNIAIRDLRLGRPPDVIHFTGLTAFDVQRIKNGQMGNLNRDSASVMGALVLYLDFVNLFLMMLRIFGSSR